ncbi:MAG: arylsulfatase [Gemmataceae bacterium]
MQSPFPAFHQNLTEYIKTFWAFPVGILVLLLCANDANAQQNSTPPNIVFILADDLGIGDLGCYNSDSKIPTPNLDRLAKMGIRFTDAHSPSAVCTPTRYGVLTGRYCWRSRLKRGVLGGYSPILIEPGRMTLASLLKTKGYHTACVGKWHLGLGKSKKTDYTKPLTPGPNSVGFDYFFGIPASLDMTPYVFVENTKPLQRPTETIKGSKHRRQKGGGFWRGGPIAPEFRHIDVLPKLTEKAVNYMESRAKEDQPFFLYFPLTAPHTPWLPTKEFRGKTMVGYYGDFVAQVDATVGQVMNTLERLKLSDNTIVIVTSDNGSHWPIADIMRWGHSANWILRGQKADIWEGGHRVPFIVYWPGHTPANRESHETICLTDTLATFAEIVGAGLPKNTGEDSHNILPAILGKKLRRPIREATIHHSSRGVFAIRQGDWVLIEGLGSGGFTRPAVIKPKKSGPKGQLYDLKTDIAQKRNVYLENPQRVQQMRALLTRYKMQGFSRPMRD